jgi:hypothetical protein
MPFFVDDTRHWRERAVQARQLAEKIEDPVQQQAMLDIALAYDRMAERADARLSTTEDSDR